MSRIRLALLCAALAMPATPVELTKKGKKKNAEPVTALDRYLSEVKQRPGPDASLASAGSLYAPNGRFGDLFRDLRATQVDDIVTILVSDRASAITKGTTNTARKSSLKAGVQSLAGPTKAASALANLAGMTGDQQLQGQGTTSRDSSLTTNLSARVTQTLPNGNLVVVGVKEIVVNSERQTVTVRGIVRPQDLTSTNTVPSDRLANLEVHVNGKGVVGDSIRRPFILYRLLMGLLPF